MSPDNQPCCYANVQECFEVVGEKGWIIAITTLITIMTITTLTIMAWKIEILASRSSLLEALTVDHCRELYPHWVAA